MLKEPVNTAFETYRPVRMVGEGGSGAVYEARNSANEPFALKCLKPNLATSRRKRFKNEILFCQRCQHPNIVPVLDTGAIQIGGDTVSFYVMPYYSKTLRSLIETGIAPVEIMRLFSQLLDGVEAAHLFGVYHRDLKPENVLYDESSKNLVVADFGAAEFTEDELYTLVETKPGERIGNFQYAAPEQRSRGGRVDHRSDIYALGLILNEMYTGEVPSGTGHRQIASIFAQDGYLDGLVETMRRQSPEDRPSSIHEVKAQISARGNEFIAFQRLSSLKNTVLPTTVPDDPLLTNPVKVVELDYQDGDLVFVLEPKPSAKWIEVFQHPRTSYTSAQNRGPETVRFINNRGILQMSEHAVVSAVRYFKEWVDSANRTFPEVLAREARDRDASEREQLRRNVEAEEQRQQVLQRARRALES